MPIRFLPLITGDDVSALIRGVKGDVPDIESMPVFLTRVRSLADFLDRDLMSKFQQ
jgi:hypothetical protein